VTFRKASTKSFDRLPISQLSSRAPSRMTPESFFDELPSIMDQVPPLPGEGVLEETGVESSNTGYAGAQ